MEKTPNTEETINSPGVLEKYTAAGQICQLVLKEVIAKCVAGANIAEICSFGDSKIEEETKKVFKGKKIERGVAFPTCINVNEVCGHYSPLKSEPTFLAAGDVVKM